MKRPNLVFDRNEIFKDIDTMLRAENITNSLLSRIIEKIEIEENGHMDVYLKLFSDIGLSESVHLSDNCT